MGNCGELSAVVSTLIGYRSSAALCLTAVICFSYRTWQELPRYKGEERKGELCNSVR